MIDIKSILFFTKHDPLAVLGFLLIGLSGWQSFVVLKRLGESGHQFPGFFERWSMIGTMPVAYLYLKTRNQRGWSPWPAYLIWIFAVGGIAALIAGLFRLPG